MTDVVAYRFPAPPVVKFANIAAKAGLVLLLLFAVLFPEASNLQNKAAGARAVGYPLASFAIPAIWYVFWRDRASFPWVADLLVTITCFTDILGNRLDLYDKIVWFDDWMHFMNTGFLAGAIILLTMHHSTSLLAVLERSLAFGATAAIAWEIAEYFAFISGHAERRFAYADTLSDLAMGVMGSIFAAVLIHSLWRAGRLRSAAPQLETAYAARQPAQIQA